MSEVRLGNELERIHKEFLFLWKDYDFHIKYFTRDHSMHDRGFMIGLGNNVCKLVLKKKTHASDELFTCYVGTRSAWFTPPNDSYSASYHWYALAELSQWLSSDQHDVNNSADKGLEDLSHYLKSHMDRLLALMQDPKEVERKLGCQRNPRNENEITVEKIRVEQRRLQSLGQDSSHQAALANLRGGKK